MTSDQSLSGMPIPNSACSSQPSLKLGTECCGLTSAWGRSHAELEHYRTLYESNPSIYFTLTSTGTILSINQFGAARLGYIAEELVETSVFELFHPEDRASLQAGLASFTQFAAVSSDNHQAASNWEFRQICQDGKIIWVKAIAQLVVGMERTALGERPTTTVLLVCEDITERKQAELGLWKERNLISAIVDTVANLIVVLDLQGRIVQFNRACEQTTGYCAEEVKGIPFWDILLLPKEVEPVKTAFSHLCAGQFPNTYENCWVTKQGDRRLISWSNTAIVDPQGQIEYIIGTGLDVTEQRETEQALRRSQQQEYQRLVDWIDGIVWEADLRTGKFSLVSQKAEQILGFPLTDWITEPHFWENHIHPDDREWVVAACIENAKTQTEYNLEYRMVAADGRAVWLKDIVSVVPGSEGMQLRGVMIDITEQKQGEAALRDSEERYRAVVEQAWEGIFLIDADTKQLLEANAAFCQLMGYSTQEITQLTIYDIVAASQESVDNNIQRILEAKHYFLGERQYCRKDGSLLDVEVVVSLIVYGGRTVHCVLVRDITERKRVAAELERSLSLLRATLESTADGIVAVSNEKEIVSFNRKFVDMWQIPPAIMDSPNFGERIGFLATQVKDAERFLQKLRELYHQPDAEVHDFLEFQDGRVFERSSQPQRIGDQIVGRVWSFRDITKRKQAEAALARSEAKWRSLIQNSSDIIAILGIDGSIRYHSPSTARVLGYAPNDLMGKKAFDFIHPDDLPTVIQAIDWVVQSGVSTLSMEFRFHHKDGSWRVLESTGSNLLSDPVVEGIVINSRDITERKRIEETLRMRTEQERLMRLIAQRIHDSLDLSKILNTTVAAVRQFLNADRVIVFNLESEGYGVVNVESVAAPWMPMAKTVIQDPCLAKIAARFDQPQQIRAIDDIYKAGLHPCYIELLERFQVKANLVVPIWQGEHLWGLLIAHHCAALRKWQLSEIEFLDELATQVAIAIQQSELYYQVQRLNAQLESQVQERTAQLQKALDFEAMLKRITDKVRDSLDESHILQTAVQELALVLGVSCCDTALYDPDCTISTICYEYTTTIPASWGRVLKMADFPEIYSQLLQGQYFQFCEIFINPCRTQVAMLACPIFDNQGVLGDLWLFKSKEEVFTDLEIRLVQQVANQCAIAIRQARLYQAAQTQVQVLEKLNHLKDDFLSTVSHELRTPVCNMNIAIQMLELSLKRDCQLQEMPAKTARYLQILHDECSREINLINNLLDLQRLEAEAEPLVLDIIHLQDWLPDLVQPFYGRAQNRQQQLRINLPNHLAPIVSNASSLHRILSELLNNACKYTPPGEEIAVEAMAIANNQVRLKVSNFGVEIPASELPHIFEKFYRVPSTDPWKQGGTGLGLALVKKLTEHLGGNLSVESANQQTCFMVDLPCSRTP